MLKVGKFKEWGERLGDPERREVKEANNGIVSWKDSKKPTAERGAISGIAIKMTKNQERL